MCQKIFAPAARQEDMDFLRGIFRKNVTFWIFHGGGGNRRAGSKSRKIRLKLFSDEFLAYPGPFARRIEIFVIFG